MLDIYKILHIPESIVLQNNINHLLDLNSSDPQERLRSINIVISSIEKLHSYFHFEQSFAYTLRAYVLNAMGDIDSVRGALDKALFQDPLNHIARSLPEELPDILAYNKNIKYEADFLRFAIGDFKYLEQVRVLDLAINAVYEREIDKACALLDELDYDSHRLWLARAIANIYHGDFESSLLNSGNAVSMLEESHPSYHQYASSVYKLRAEVFMSLGKLELAKNDIVKAQNLFPD